MFDAQLALGHYADAAISLGALNAEASGPSVQVRRQVLLETQGSYQEAIALAEQALADARVFGLGGEALVWYVVNAAELHLRYGETEMADELFAEAIDLLPAYAPALSGRGEVALAEGDAEEAVAWLNQAAAIAPQPEFLIALLRANESVGRAAEATSVAAQLDAEVQLTLAGNGTSNRLLALYLVDAGLNLGAAQTLAEREAERRADVLTLDTLAWVRLAAGDVGGALESSTAALEVGTQDPLILYHAGVIRAASGDSDGARVLLERCLSLNPAFDALHATRAAALLDELSSSQR
jgi:tetratricopeptide (TPR) repeat protein